MGLDLLDIKFRIEKTFEVELSFDDFTGLARDRDIAVGDLYELLLKRMYLHDTARNNVRLNYGLWTQIQQDLNAATRVPLERIELKTPLGALFPRKTRRARWGELLEACPYRVRELDYPRAVRLVGFLLAAGIMLIELLQIWQIPGANWVWPLLGVLGVWMFFETYLKILSIFAPLRIAFPSGWSTVKDLCRAVLATNYADICQTAQIPLDHRCLVVWQQLTEILVDALGIEAEQVTFRSRLVHDLGME